MEFVTATLTGIALVKKSVDFIKENISTVNDIKGIAQQIDGFFEGEAQMNKNQGKGFGFKEQFGIESSATDFIDRKLLEEKRQELKTIINMRFGPTAWDEILSERAERINQAKEAQRKAYQERKARERGGSSSPSTAKSKEKAASELLKKKTTKAVSPNYKPAKASGKTRAERDKIRGEGERYLKSVFKDQETAKYKKETGQNPDAKGRTKILGRVNKRMST